MFCLFGIGTYSYLSGCCMFPRSLSRQARHALHSVLKFQIARSRDIEDTFDVRCLKKTRGQGGVLGYQGEPGVFA